MPRTGQGGNELSAAVNALQTFANQAIQAKERQRQVDLQEKLATLRLGQAQDELRVSNINATANLLNALQQSGFIKDVDVPELQKSIPFLKEFQAGVPRELRKGEARLGVEKLKASERKKLEQVKIAGKEKAIRAAGEEARKTGAQKIGAQQKQLRQRMAVESAKFGLTPSDIARGSEAVEETEVVSPVRTGQTIIAIPGGFLGVGKKDVTTDDIINVVGSKEVTPELEQDIRFLNEALKARPDKKTIIIERFVERNPDLGELF